MTVIWHDPRYDTTITLMRTNPQRDSPYCTSC